MVRHLLAVAALILGCVPAIAADRTADPVDSAILEAPTADHVPTLIAALNGSGCKPVHNDVRDALVKIGRPAVAPLVERLNGSSQWWIQLECVYVLGLMGPEAADAEVDLARFVEESRHLLPRSYASASLAAVRSDPQALLELVETTKSSFVPFSLELLHRMDADAARVIPSLREFAQSASGGRAALVAGFLEEYDAGIVLSAGE